MAAWQLTGMAAWQPTSASGHFPETAAAILPSLVAIFLRTGWMAILHWTIPIDMHGSLLGLCMVAIFL